MTSSRLLGCWRVTPIENGLLAGLPVSVRDRLARDLGRLLAEVESDTSG